MKADGIIKGGAVILALALCMGTAAPAMAAVDSPDGQVTVVCMPYEEQECAQNVPSHTFGVDGDVPSEYTGFLFTTDSNQMESVEWQPDAWTKSDYQGTLPEAAAMYPLHTGAWVRLNGVGVWHSATGDVELDARITVIDWNGGSITVYSRLDGVTVSNNNGVQGIPGILKDSYDPDKRSGIGLRVEFMKHGTDTLANGLKGYTGFNDLDGDPWHPTVPYEGWELLSGWAGIWRTPDDKLAAYGENGLAGVRDTNGNEGPESTTPIRGQEHRFTAVFDGPVIEARFSVDEMRMGSSFGAALREDQISYPLVYDLNGGAGAIPNKQ